MLNLTDKGSSSTRRLVLGFDAGCLTCSDLARSIKEQVGGKLEIRSLKDPQVEQWRKSALGNDAPWAPTLIEIKGPKVRAWTGWRLGINLSRLLGPVATWRVMQALGEIGATPEAERHQAFGVLTRGQFLKGVGGTAVAMTVLSGAGKLARPAHAAKITNAKKYNGNTLISLARSRAKTPDLIGVGGKTWSDGMQTGRVASLCRTVKGEEVCMTIIRHDRSATGTSRWRSDGTLSLVDGDTAIFAAKHTYSDGNTRTVVSYLQSDDRVIHSYRYAEQVGRGIRSEAASWRYDAARKKFFWTKSAHNGAFDRLVTDTTAQTQDGTVTPQNHETCVDDCSAYYSEDYGYYGYYLNTNIYGGVDFNCVGRTIATCTFCEYLAVAPPAGPGDALACFLVCAAGDLFYCSTFGGEACISCYG